MIHYHGLPITPATTAIAAVGGGHAFVSFAHQQQVSIALEACQSFAIDNGAWSAWKGGEPIRDWQPYYDFCEDLLRHPSCDWAIIPDVIDGSEAEQNALLDAWPFDLCRSVPVWHMHETIARLTSLSIAYPRVALGSSGQFRQIGTSTWWSRMGEAMNAICVDGTPICKLHGLRMLDPDIFTRLPFASADSTNIARNVGIDSRWLGTYTPPTKEARALLLRQRIEAYQAAQSWTDQPIQEDLCLQQSLV